METGLLCAKNISPIPVLSMVTKNVIQSLFRCTKKLRTRWQLDSWLYRLAMTD